MDYQNVKVDVHVFKYSFFQKDYFLTKTLFFIEFEPMIEI